MPVRRRRAAVPTVNSPFYREPTFAHVTALSDNNINSGSSGNVKAKKLFFFEFKFFRYSFFVFLDFEHC